MRETFRLQYGMLAELNWRDKKMYRRALIATSLLTAMAFAAPQPGHAQGTPSADQIINSLKPGTGSLGNTRGIRPITPSSEPAAPAGAPRPASRPGAAATPPVAANPSIDLSVQFATNSAQLTPAAIKTLTELGRALSSESLSSFHFRIEGHTDTVGSTATNKALSERRAQAVVAFLTSTFKIDAARLEPVGMGEDGLMVQTPQNVAEPRNRRVQVINTGA